MSDDLFRHIERMQAKAYQLQVIVAAIEAFAGDPNRAAALSSLASGAFSIARELNGGLDSVAVRETLE